ncbi:MAG: septal ring lytic transglycosylase RlpA family protein [Adhaeribacter sp.]
MKIFTHFFCRMLLGMAFLAAWSCSPRFTESGKASYYSNKFQGRKMANGDPYRKGKLTAAHKTLPFGTKVKVTNQQNGKTVKVKITDRGPHTRGRIVDLSLAAANRLDMVSAGTVPVKLKVIRQPKASGR